MSNYSPRAIRTARNLIRFGMRNGAETHEAAVAMLILTVETTPEPPADSDDALFAEWQDLVFLVDELRLGIADPALVLPTN